MKISLRLFIYLFLGYFQQCVHSACVDFLAAENAAVP